MAEYQCHSHEAEGYLMGRVSELAMEKDEKLAALHRSYENAFAALLEYQDRHPPAHRTIKEMDEVSRLTSICSFAKFQYEKADSEKWKI